MVVGGPRDVGARGGVVGGNTDYHVGGGVELAGDHTPLIKIARILRQCTRISRGIKHGHRVERAHDGRHRLCGDLMHGQEDEGNCAGEDDEEGNDHPDHAGSLLHF